MVSDEVLERVRAKHGIAAPAAELRHIIERVAATPAARFRDDWWRVVAPDAGPAAAQALREVASAVRAPRPAKDPSRLDRLRERMRAAGLDALVVPQADEHQSGSLPASARRLEWLTGFTGSAGTAVVAAERAWLFVDGRYLLQAGNEVDPSRWEVRHFRKPPTWQFVSDELRRESSIGYDPRLHSVTEVGQIAKATAARGHRLVALDANPIDGLWSDRPPPPFAPVVPHALAYSGRPADDKLDEVAALLRAKEANAVALNQLESIAWLLNIRGGDAAHTPVAQAYCIVFDDGRAELFVERRKLTPATVAHLGNRTAVRDVAEFAEGLRGLGRRGLTVALDPDRATQWMRDVVEQGGARVVTMDDPTAERRIRKNEVELRNLADAMARDGAALARFLRWIGEATLHSRVTETAAAERVIAVRAEDPMFRGPSFDPIVAAGPNGAITHYHPGPATDRVIEPGTLLLVDSGGQYLTGTTDITRTLAIGEPDAEARRCFTLVLKSHVALATARFPKGATGAQLDAIARAPLWRGLVNFDHGTGHGIGSYLAVHEGPIRIAEGATHALDVGMVVSNEPGAYFAGRFGIRTENTVTVVPAGTGEGGAEFLGFETLSLAPIDRALIDPGLLTPDEVAWLDRYHATVRARLAPRLSGEDAAWLERATAPLVRR